MLWLKLASVLSRDDVPMNGFHVGRPGHSSSHYALKEIPCSPVAVVTARSEDDGSFLIHRSIAFGKKDNASAGKASGLSIALVNGVAALTVIGSHVGNESGAGGNCEMAVEAV